MGPPAAAGGSEVWLEGNVRPLLGLAALALGLSAIAALAVGAGAMPWWLAGAVIAVLAAGVGLFTFVAGRPRLARRGDALFVHLSPFVVRRVPLEIVECVFHGSQPIDATAAGSPRRVGTLVIRLAERATEWRQRPTFAPWGTWQDGHIVCDGRWCEPLTVEVARSVGNRLLEAKRSVVPVRPAP